MWLSIELLNSKIVVFTLGSLDLLGLSPSKAGWDEIFWGLFGKPGWELGFDWVLTGFSGF